MIQRETFPVRGTPEEELWCAWVTNSPRWKSDKLTWVIVGVDFLARFGVTFLVSWQIRVRRGIWPFLLIFPARNDGEVKKQGMRAFCDVYWNQYASNRGLRWKCLSRWEAIIIITVITVNVQMKSVWGIPFDFKAYPLDLLSGFWSLFFASGKWGNVMSPFTGCCKIKGKGQMKRNTL